MEDNGQDIKSPLSNLMFDWVTLLHEKAKGLEAYATYLKDAEERHADKCIALMQELRDQDVKAVQRIKDHVAFMFDKEAQKSRQSVAAGQDQEAQAGATMRH